MPADSGNRRPVRVPGTMGPHPPPQLTGQLPFPRCDSTSTKFCYYNNYNLSQPRYFCKSCRRNWTQGGTLRNIPVGGGTRKVSKRSRCSSVSSHCSVATSSSTSSVYTHEAESSVPMTVNPISPVPEPAGAKPEMGLGVVNLNDSCDLPVNGGFTSFLNYQGDGYLTLGGYGFGAGSGFDGVWGYPGNGYLGGFNGGGSGGAGGVGGTTRCNSWQATSDVEGGGGLVDEDCFGWPGFAISAPGKSL